MDIASLVIGIVAVIIGFIPCVQIFVFLPALVGLILGIVSFLRKRQVEEPAGIALAGILLNAIPLVIMTVLAIFVGFSADAAHINDMTIK